MIVDETAKDSELQDLLKTIKEGWPTQKHLLPESLKPFWKCRAEITEQKGLLLRDQRIIIPKSLQKDILNSLHYTHLEDVS